MARLQVSIYSRSGSNTLREVIGVCYLAAEAADTCARPVMPASP